MTLTLGFMRKKKRKKKQEKKKRREKKKKKKKNSYCMGEDGLGRAWGDWGGGGGAPFQPLCFLCIGDYFYQCDARDDLVTASVLLFELPEIKTEKRGEKKKKKREEERLSRRSSFRKEPKALGGQCCGETRLQDSAESKVNPVSTIICVCRDQSHGCASP